ncbi:4Fe-4S dicluster domain-containing protein [Ktedonosporobacter rubrisoli]|uniref:4Fe-4S dicluster domain-containing protein n=1 Tax=Ktedonosporobacter rubrisoli TaxID=2509675 RepID=A0A4P6K1U4_KTERU|nr:4Fe-4S dicluster domain-containing protein [Ktedonosporobacter rubrisoli]QBD82079.1 4Fe-4S dicluster domain-containing protein [Ktedonosporobacter rubrisoli]
MAVESRPAQQSLVQAGAQLLQNALAPLHKEEPPAPQPAMGFFTDTSICIGCKACEVACRQWNQLPAPDPTWSGSSYDNTRQLGATTWRHVQFIEKIERRKPVSEETSAPSLPLFNNLEGASSPIADPPPGTALPFFNTERWLMHSDVCKHCANAPCLEACPTGAIIRTEFDTVYVQQDICNGCGYCVVACPFGVIARDEKGDHTAHKCTLCYDRLKEGIEPACAKACPTDSIIFGEVDQLKKQARERLGILHERGVKEARLYGADDAILEGGLNSFFLLLDEPEVYNLPRNPERPARNVAPASFLTIAAAAILSLLGIFIFKE